jgi:hypothetical protein
MEKEKTLLGKEEKKDGKKEEKFLPGMGVDVGTSNIVVTRMTTDNVFVHKTHRDMLFQLDASEESEEMIDRGSYLCVKTKDKYFVVGEDALKIASAINRSEDIVRPMKDGILNPNLSTSSELLFFIIKALCGDPIEKGEKIRFSIPANPINGEIDNKFHQMVLKSFFDKLGYDSKAVVEGAALCYDCNPILKEEDGNEVGLSGVGISFGGGMVNVSLLFRGLELDNFSIVKSGDEIDMRTSMVTGIPLANVIRAKEKKLDLTNIDMTDRVQQALSVYYDEMIERVVKSIGKNFKDKKSEMEGKIEIVVGGGTSLCKGFIPRLEEGFKKFPIPFDILTVRHSKTPFYSVSSGACIRARADIERAKK